MAAKKPSAPKPRSKKPEETATEPPEATSEAPSAPEEAPEVAPEGAPVLETPEAPVAPPVGGAEPVVPEGHVYTGAPHRHETANPDVPNPPEPYRADGTIPPNQQSQA